MTDLTIKETANTPAITFDSKNNVWSVSGRSYHRSSASVYDPLLKWVEKIEKSPVDHCSFNFRIELMNTSSSKVLLEVLKRLKSVFEQNNGSLSVRWYYDQDDDDMKETGEIMMSYSELPFEFVLVPAD